MILLRNVNRSFTQHRLQTLCLNSRIVGSSTTFYRSESSASSSGQPGSAGPKRSTLSGILIKSFGYSLVTTGIIVGGFAYVYNNPEVRKKVEHYVPYSKELFDRINELNRQSETLSLAKITDRFRNDEKPLPIKKKPAEVPPVTASEHGKLKLTTVGDLSPPPTALPTTKSEAKHIDINPVDVHEKPDAKSGHKEAAKATGIDEEYEAKLVETLKVAGDNANAAKDSKFKTLKATQNYSTLVKEAVDSGIEQNESAEVWKKVKIAKEEMEKIARQDSGDEAKARAAIEALKQVITEGRKRKLETPTIQNAIATVKKLSGRLDELNLMIQKERTQTRVFSQYKELMEAGRQQWADELSAAFPDINLRAKEGSLTEEELNAFIVHASTRINQLKEQLAELQSHEEEKISQAIEEQRRMDEQLARLHLEIELRRIRENENLEVDEKIREERKLWESEVEAQLRRAAMAHAEHLEKVIKTQKQLHDIENAQLIEEAVKVERGKFAKQIGSAVEKLNGIEQALNSRTAQDLENRRAKIFWTVCQNLLDSLVNGDGGADGQIQYNTKLKEVNFIKELAENDDFVQSICNCFPKEATEGGIPTEIGLMQRFEKAYKIARRVAQVDENGGGPLEYFLSWLQSMFILQFSARAYASDEQIDTTKYEPYELLNRIKYFAEVDDMTNAVRLANLLRGESAQVFRDWISDAQKHLEARFLAEVLLSHAQISSVRTTY